MSASNRTIEGEASADPMPKAYWTSSPSQRTWDRIDTNLLLLVSQKESICGVASHEYRDLPRSH